jgi:hypothetical protein
MNESNTHMSDIQISCLAERLLETIRTFYNDPKNEEKFQLWLREKLKTQYSNVPL